MARDEALLEYRVGGETEPSSAVSSPRLDAMDIGGPGAAAATLPSSSSVPPGGLGAALRGGVPGEAAAAATAVVPGQGAGVDDGTAAAAGLMHMAQPWWGLDDQTGNGDGAAQPVFPMDWSWLLGESGQAGYQTGDPTTFWSQL